MWNAVYVRGRKRSVKTRTCRKTNGLFDWVRSLQKWVPKYKLNQFCKWCFRIKLKSFPKPISTWHEATWSGLNQILKDTEICEKLYPDCREIPENYRHPGIMLPKETDQTEVRLLLDAIDPIYDKWRQNSTLHYFGNFTFV